MYVTTSSDNYYITRNGVKETTFEAKAKDSKKKIRGQGQTFRVQTFLKPWTEVVKAKDKNGQGQGPMTQFFKIWSANFPLFFSAKIFAKIAFRLVFDDNSKTVVFEA